MSSKAELRAVREEPDPLLRARRATTLMNDFQQQSVELARVRREAIEEAARTRGLSFTQVAHELGLSKGRITQIRQTAPPVERAFFGVGPVRVAVPVRTIGDRDLGVVAAEDAQSAETTATGLRRLAFEVTRAEVPADGSWTHTGDAVLICGPKSSARVGKLIEDDPYLDFQPDATGHWTITEKSSGRPYRSGLDEQPPVNRDAAYLSARTINDSRLVLVAGVHAIGSLGAVTHLFQHLPDLYRETKAHANFSAVIESTCEGLTIVQADRVSDLHLWD